MKWNKSEIISCEIPCYALKGIGSQKLTLLVNFNDFMEKEPCSKFCGILISSHEVMKLQSFESGVSDVIPANV